MVEALQVTMGAMDKLIEQLRQELENDPEYLSLFSESLKDSKPDVVTVEEDASYLSDGELGRYDPKSSPVI